MYEIVIQGEGSMPGTSLGCESYWKNCHNMERHLCQESTLTFL